MSNRIYALVCNDNVDFVKKNVSILTSYNDGSKVLVFSKSGDICENSITIPEDCVGIGSKIHNFVCKKIFEIEPDFKGFAHIIQDTIELRDGHNKYVSELENIMNILDYDIHFSTITDPCNYVYSKFNPRLILNFDNDTFKSLNPPAELNITSHSNTEYITLNFAKYNEATYLMDERFSIPMFYIIEFLVRRKNNRIGKQPYYMNQYIGISSEKTAYTCNKGEDNIDPERMKVEDELFKSLKLDHMPDNNIDESLETIYEKMLEKLNK